MPRWRSATFAAVHRAIDGGLVRACHDLSEGGLAVAAAEMAFAGGLGAWIALDTVPSPLWTTADDESTFEPVLLFSRIEHADSCAKSSRRILSDLKMFCERLPLGRIGEVRNDGRIQIFGNSSASPLIDVDCLAAEGSLAGDVQVVELERYASERPK